MAEVISRDVVNQTRSVGDRSPSDVPVTTYNADSKRAGEDLGIERGESRENGIHTSLHNKNDEPDDASARSDTDTSRADGSVSGDKASDQKTLRKFVAKPVSFAKYSVPKVVAANAATKSADKVATPSSASSSLQQVGRPRLVAKTTSSLQQKSKPFKPSAPDPMQVWNKNRVTPQPSTKHLTDEELKQQYGIHLTSRIQSEQEGKEAKWADIDDDEDDWAPETIEWSDGTKTTINPADIISPSTPKSKTETPDPETEKTNASQPRKSIASQFTSTVGPNAMVLKIGASAERQQAQKAAIQQQKASVEKPMSASQNSMPAPTPKKSPWAQLPPVDKISPVIINPQVPAQSLQRHLSMSGSIDGPISNLPENSPAKEMSADDFNRSWREPANGQPRELFMPNSGRYETVPESRRRMSRNDQNFRAPAVLQRPSQSDVHAPAEPSAAFQTNRTSESARRRASSIISGSSGQFARRLSMKSGDAPPVFDGPEIRTDGPGRPMSSDGPPSQLQTPTYQARGSSTDNMNASGAPVAVQADLEVQRAQQKALMRENIERARRRKQEEEERLEAEKKERIRLKLASLGPDPRLAEPKIETQAEEEPVDKPEEPAPEPVSANPPTGHSPPKPPQPLPTGEPQQYGMMKVHALDSIKKPFTASHHSPAPVSPPTAASKEPATESPSLATQIESQSASIGTSSSEPAKTTVSDTMSTPPPVSAPSPKVSKSKPAPLENRGGWGDMRHEHRTPQSNNLWGIPNNKALGNGTFDHSLAGYAPQDLSRSSSSIPGWPNGRTPTSGTSPQPQYANFHLPDTMSQSQPSAASPEPQPLAANSEVDSMFPTTRPTPIAPPQSHVPPHAVNGYTGSPQVNGGLAAWNNFHHTASQQERLDAERFQRELAARREEETRTGVRHGPQYTFQETWKQVHLGDQAGQRQVANVTQSSLPSANMFSSLGSLPSPDASARTAHPQPARGSRFFPANMNGLSIPDRRAFTYNIPETPRTPSPPPAEELSSFHPAFDGSVYRPVVHFPREKAIVKLPPAAPPTPPLAPVQPPAQPEAPLTWAARVSMPAPVATPAVRSVSTPIAQNPSWQERFNGLLGKKPSAATKSSQSIGPALAVTSSTREPLDNIPATIAASVSLPQSMVVEVEQEEEVEEGSSEMYSKDVEAEDDLFEDREPGSLPIVTLPKDGVNARWTPPMTILSLPLAVDPTSAHCFMVSNLFEKKFLKPQFAIIQFPGQTRSIKKDLPMKGSPVAGNGIALSRSRHSSGAFNGKHVKHNNGNRIVSKPRGIPKVH